MDGQKLDTFNHTDFEREKIAEMSPRKSVLSPDASPLPGYPYTGNRQQFECDQFRDGETQESIGSWSVATFGPSDDPKPQALRLLAEVIELCLVSNVGLQELHNAVHRATDPYDWEEGDDDEFTLAPDKIPEELADVQIVASQMAHRLGIDLARETRKKMLKNRSRTWNVRGDGTGQHTNEEQ